MTNLLDLGVLKCTQELMENNTYPQVAVIVLAAGKGTRLKMPNGINKTTLEVKGKPMIESTIEIIENLGVGQIIAVVGHGKVSVERLLGNRVDYALQNKRLGTGHAALCGLKHVKSGIQFVVVVHGDDSHSYSPDVYHHLISACSQGNYDMAHMVMYLDNPFGLGRIIRDSDNHILRVTEEKNASDIEKKIQEVNAGAYCFKLEFAQKFLPKINFNTVKHEKYLTDIIEIAVNNKRTVASVKLNDTKQWIGINTLEELNRANQV